jgi:hypothetical protein
LGGERFRKRDTMSRPSRRSLFLGDAGAKFFCIGRDVFRDPWHRGRRFVLNASPFGRRRFAPTAVPELIHQGPGQMKRSKGGQIKLTETPDVQSPETYFGISAIVAPAPMITSFGGRMPST